MGLAGKSTGAEIFFGCRVDPRVRRSSGDHKEICPMRFISIFSHPAPSAPPSPEMMAKMGALIEEA